MVVDNSTYLPSYKDLNVPELKVSYPFLKAASFHLGKYCEEECKEFMLCRNEERDPRKCLTEGKDVTSCGIKFFQKVKKHCRPELDAFTHCLDHGSGQLYFYPCRDLRLKFDECMEDNFSLKRPEMGYFVRPKIHESSRPKPIHEHRDYDGEAKKILAEIPEGQSQYLKEEYRPYYAENAGFDWGLW